MAPKFKIGDYVKTNPENEDVLEFGKQYYVGKVVDYDIYTGYTVELDARTILEMSEDYMREMMIRHLMFEEQFFDEEELLPAEKRDTEADATAAVKRLESTRQDLMDKGLITASDESEELSLPDWESQDSEEDSNYILDLYHRSEKLAALSEDDRVSVVDDARYMLEVAYNYFDYGHPEDWDLHFLEDFMLGHIPAKMIADDESLRQSGANYVRFLEWLDAEGLYHGTGKKMITTARALIPKMVKAATDDSNFSFSKLLLQEGMKEGVDFTDKSQSDAYLKRMNERLQGLPSSPTPRKPPAKVVGLDPFRKLGRNDKVTVRDTRTGEVTEGVKFKKVEGDLRAGKLELIG